VSASHFASATRITSAARVTSAAEALRHASALYRKYLSVLVNEHVMLSLYYIDVGRMVSDIEEIK